MLNPRVPKYIYNENFGYNVLWYNLEYQGMYYRSYIYSEDYSFFYSEMAIMLNVLQADYDFFFIEGESTKKHVLNDEDIKFLDENTAFDIESGQYIVPINIINLRNSKFLDLNYIDSIDGIKFIYFIPKVDKFFNVFYDLFIGLKKNHNVDTQKVFDNFNSNIINVKNILPLAQIIVDINFLQKTFNFENIIFKDANLTIWQVRHWSGTEQADKTEAGLKYKTYDNWFDNNKERKNWSDLEWFNYKTQWNLLRDAWESEVKKFESDINYKNTILKKLCMQILHYDEHYIEDYSVSQGYTLKSEFSVILNPSWLTMKETLNSTIKLEVKYDDWSNIFNLFDEGVNPLFISHVLVQKDEKK